MSFLTAASERSSSGLSGAVSGASFSGTSFSCGLALMLLAMSLQPALSPRRIAVLPRRRLADAKALRDKARKEREETGKSDVGARLRLEEECSRAIERGVEDGVRRSYGCGDMKMAVVASLLLVSVQTTSAQYYDNYNRPVENFYYQNSDSAAAENELRDAKALRDKARKDREETGKSDVDARLHLRDACAHAIERGV